MKKINKITATIFLPLVLLFTSCFDPIFYEIRKDVKPEESTVYGYIGQITRFTMNDEEYLFLSANDGLRYKKASNQSHGSWSTMSLPFNLVSFNFNDTSMDGKQLIGVYANSDTLYLALAPYITTGSEGNSIPWELELWGTKTPSDKGSWKKIDISLPIGYYSSTDKYTSLFHVFQTNAPKQEHRFAYVYNNVNEKYYRLEGTTPVDITTEISIVDSGSLAWSAAYFGGGVKFFFSKAVTTDEAYDYDDDPSNDAETDAKHLYYANGEELWYSDSNSESGYSKACSAGRTISALATTKDSILIGLGNITSTSSNYGGITRVLLDDKGIPAQSTTGFDSNADFQITTAYEVLTLLNATPDKSEAESALYSSIAFSGYSGLYENICLWSYYPDRGNWNYE